MFFRCDKIAISAISSTGARLGWIVLIDGDRVHSRPHDFFSHTIGFSSHNWDSEANLRRVARVSSSDLQEKVGPTSVILLLKCQ